MKHKPHPLHLRIFPIFAILGLFLTACRSGGTATIVTQPMITARTSVASTSTFTKTPQPVSISPTVVTITPTATRQTSTVVAPIPIATQLIPTNIPSATSTPFFSPTSTSLPIPYSFYASVPDGEYIVYEFVHANQLMGLGLVSPDGSTQILAYFPFTLDFSLSEDGKKLAYFIYEKIDPLNPRKLYVLDLVNNSIQEFPTVIGCQFAPSWSPDNTKLAMQCYDENSFFQEINILTIATSELIPVTKTDRSILYSPRSPAWSPDGRWIAYFYGPGVVPPPNCGNPGDGIYIIDTNCLDKPEACLKKTPLLLDYKKCYRPPLWWSPVDSQIATSFNGILTIVDPWGGTYTSLPEIENHNKIAWSPDGKQLAVNYPRDETISVIPITGGKPKLVVENAGQVVAWIRKLTFNVGDLLTITPCGYDLKFHDSPSVASTVLRKLQPGDTVTILEGPVEADGYTWWKMKTKDGLEGWAVEVSVWYEPVSTATPTPSP